MGKDPFSASEHRRQDKAVIRKPCTLPPQGKMALSLLLTGTSLQLTLFHKLRLTLVWKTTLPFGMIQNCVNVLDLMLTAMQYVRSCTCVQTHALRSFILQVWGYTIWISGNRIIYKSSMNEFKIKEQERKYISFRKRELESIVSQ